MSVAAANGPKFSSGRERARPDQLWRGTILWIGLFVACAIAWASWAKVEEISRASGRIIPSGKTQIIQSAEPGVVAEILVRPGETVSQGQLLVRLDDTNVTSSAGEVKARVMALQAQVARLRIEYDNVIGADYACPKSVEEISPDVCKNEAQLLKARAESFAQGKQVLLQRVEQRQRELNEASAQEDRLERGAALAEEKLNLLAPLAEKELVAKTEFIAAQRDMSDQQGQLAATREAKARLEAALAEAQLQVQQAELQFRQEALSEMTLRLAELASNEEVLRGATDRVSRTDIRSPVDGIVNNVDVNTIGAVVQAGSRIMDIVPLSADVLVEAHLRPADVAFILPGQKANIKLTAYDFSIYGSLKGQVQNVSADSIIDPQTRETYYLVLVKADESALEYKGRQLPILPGMVTSVDILTGSKTILQYLLKPINKARNEALSER